MNLYFFGGSFDPPHIGHLSIIQSCVVESQQFVLIPAKQSPFKDQSTAASAHQRIRMLKLLISKIDHPIIIDDWETYIGRSILFYLNFIDKKSEISCCDSMFYVKDKKSVLVDKWGMANNSSNVVVFEFGMIAVYTLPPRFNRPNTATLPAAPRPRFPLHVSHRSNSHQLLLPPTVHSSVAYWL